MKDEGSNARRELPERVSIDSGILLAYLLGEELGRVVKEELLQPRLRLVFFSRLAIAETSYILCRRRGEQFARHAVQAFLRTGYGTLVATDERDVQAGAYKWERAISLADCYVLAVAKMKNASALFAKRESDLEKEMARRPFDVALRFLEDLLAKSGKVQRQSDAVL